MDGVRRWFQRRTSSSSSSDPTSDSNLSYPYHDKLDHVVNGDQLVTSDLRAQSTIGPKRKQTQRGGEGILEQLPEEEDLDYSALKLIKVPKRTNHFRAPLPPPPPPPPALMDSHKKVFLAVSSFFIDLEICVSFRFAFLILWIRDSVSV